ncbi:MAG: AAA family ATPase [Chloroflexota bacterium]|nr:AAA family ATPase [Chloroflexota bacterium]
MGALLDRRLVYVTGKGGVGKTTVAAALGLAAARAGKRTMVCEVAEQERITQAFGKPPTGFRETEVAPNLHAFSIDPQAAKEEWLRFRLHSGRLAGLLSQSRVYQYLTAAAPGLAELVTIGKIWELAQLQRKTAKASPYDLVVVDAPATGHGIALLRAPRTFADIARVGPLHSQTSTIHSSVTDPSFTAVVAVAVAEEIPVNETIDLERRLREQVGMDLAAVLVNGVLPERFSAAEARRIESVDGTGGEAAREALAAALAARERARGQRSQISRLRRSVEAPVATLPFLLTPELGQDDLEALSRELARKVT